MSFGAIRSALRLYKPRLVPKSRISRYGLATVVAAGIGTAYMWRRIEQSIWSDDLKPDPPLPPQYEYKYRLGARLVKMDMAASAWDLLAEVWQSALNDGADAGVVAAIALELLSAAAPAEERHAVAAQTLRQLLGAGWDDVQPRERQRAVVLALSLSPDGDQTAGWPFLQWAWAQAWHLAVLDAPQSPRFVTLLVDAGKVDRILEVLPFALVITEWCEERRKERGLTPEQQCSLSRLYSSLALNLVWRGPATFLTANEFHTRAMVVLEPPEDVELEREVCDLYNSASSRVTFQLGIQYEVMGYLDDALRMYTDSHSSMPDDDDEKDTVHAFMLRARLKAQRAAGSPPGKT